MLRIVERALAAHLSVVPTLFVDDLSAECTSPNKVIVKELGGVIEMVVDQVEACGMEISRKKSVFTANSKALRRDLEAKWKKVWH